MLNARYPIRAAAFGADWARTAGGGPSVPQTRTARRAARFSNAAGETRPGALVDQAFTVERGLEPGLLHPHLHARALFLQAHGHVDLAPELGSEAHVLVGEA